LPLGVAHDKSIRLTSGPSGHYSFWVGRPTEELSAELERAALKQVRACYREYNEALFKGTLNLPTLRWLDAATDLGQWSSEHRELGLSRVLLTDHGWGVLVEVLKHEMAHQYVDEVLGQAGGAPHSGVFRQVCEERGIDAKALGIPNANSEPGDEAKVLERVQKLLALAGSSNAHEAQAAMSAAQRLMLKHNIATVLQQGGGRYRVRHLGEPSGRVEESQRILSNILSSHFFVEVIWVPVYRPLEQKRGSVLEICGSAENLELAEYVHTFLNRTAQRLWREHKLKHNIRLNGNRRAFVSGVMMGFSNKLAAEFEKNQAAGLVWQGDADLLRYFRRRHPYIRWSSRGGRHDRDSYHAGHAAGESIVLRRAVQEGPSRDPRLLPGR
jgi:predicted SprT family Zn-dependent metalloprotease